MRLWRPAGWAWMLSGWHQGGRILLQSARQAVESLRGGTSYPEHTGLAEGGHGPHLFDMQRKWAVPVSDVFQYCVQFRQGIGRKVPQKMDGKVRMGFWNPPGTVQVQLGFDMRSVCLQSTLMMFGQGERNKQTQRIRTCVSS